MHNSERKTFLMVSYDFPPIGGGGIQRNVKFLKYLSQLSWDTNVLTVKERDFYVFDYTLLKEIRNTNVYKSGSLDPVSITFKIKTLLKKFKSKDLKKTTQISKVNEGAWYVSLYRFLRDWFFFPDGYGGWIPLAYSKGKKIIREKKPDVLFATFPFPSNAFIVYYLHRKFKIPFVIDFRDGWLDDPYTDFPSKLHRICHGYFEKKIVTAATKVIVYGEPLKISLEERYPVLKNKIEIITNGFDPEDFIDIKPVAKNENKIRIVYSGAVYVDRRETYINFIKALTQLDSSVKSSIEIIFVGDKLKWATDLVDEYNLNDIVTFTGYLTHGEALNYLASADVALMFLKIGDKVALTGKIFEYLGLGLPVMACVEPDGACANLLEKINHNHGVVSPSNIEEIKNKLEEIAKSSLPKLNREDAKIFSRKYHTEQLDKILRTIV